MDATPAVAKVIRVTLPDTLVVRTPVKELQSYATVHLALFGVECAAEAKGKIVDWVELHSDTGRLFMLTVEWLRDGYGRLVGDLADMQTGETLTGWLIAQGVAKPRPSHFAEILDAGIESEEPEV